MTAEWDATDLSLYQALAASADPRTLDRLAAEHEIRSHFHAHGAREHAAALLRIAKSRVDSQTGCASQFGRQSGGDVRLAAAVALRRGPLTHSRSNGDPSELNDSIGGEDAADWAAWWGGTSFKAEMLVSALLDRDYGDDADGSARVSNVLCSCLARAIASASPPCWPTYSHWVSWAAIEGSVPPEVLRLASQQTPSSGQPDGDPEVGLDERSLASFANAGSSAVVCNRALNLMHELMRELKLHALSTGSLPPAVQVMLGVPVFHGLKEVYRGAIEMLAFVDESSLAEDMSMFESCVKNARASLAGIKSALMHGVIPVTGGSDITSEAVLVRRYRVTERFESVGANECSEYVVTSALLVTELLRDVPVDVSILCDQATLVVAVSPVLCGALFDCARILVSLVLHLSELNSVLVGPYVGDLLRCLMHVIQAPLSDSVSAAIGTNEFGEYWYDGSLHPIERERFLAESLSGLHRLLQVSAYRCDDDAKRQISEFVAAHEGIHQTMTEKVVASLVSTILRSFLCFRARDFELWSDDPEGFVDEELRCAWQFSVREAALVLLSTLLTDFEEWSAPVLVDFASTLGRRSNVRELEAFLHSSSTAAAYTALHDRLRFADIFAHVCAHIQTVGVAEGRNSFAFRILCVRLAQLIEGWSSEVFVVAVDGSSIATLVFATLLELLKSPDYVVSLWAAVALKEVLNDYRFDHEQFRGFVVPACSALVDLLQRCNETATNIEVLRVIALIIKRMRFEFQNYVDLFEHIWKLHDACCVKQQHLLLSGICEILETLVRVVDQQIWEPYMLAFLVPIIRETCRTDSSRSVDDTLVLSEGGLALWLQMLRRTPVDSRGLAAPFQSLFPLIAHSIDRRCEDPRFWRIEHESLVLSVVQQYVYKSGSEFCRIHADSVSAILNSATCNFESLPTDGKLTACMLAGYYAQSYPSELDALRPVFAQMMEFLLSEALSLKPPDKDIKAVLVHILTSFSHLLVNNCALVESILEMAGRGKASMQEARSPDVFGIFVNTFLAECRAMTWNASSRVCAIGLAMLLRIIHPSIWVRAGLILECLLFMKSLAGGADNVDNSDFELAELLDQVTLGDSAASEGSLNSTASTTPLQLQATTLASQLLKDILSSDYCASSAGIFVIDGVPDTLSTQFTAQVVSALPTCLQREFISG